MKAVELVNITDDPIVYIGDSVTGGKGLFAKKNISRGTDIVIYYGKKITDEEIYNTYINNSDEYFKLSRYIRKTYYGPAIRGDKNITNLNLAGVYVNDISCINKDKEDLDENILREYAETFTKCNVKVVDTLDYPVYRSIKKIKKNEELYVHYGIGYWLSYIGFLPEEISKINKKYPFDSFYN